MSSFSITPSSHIKQRSGIKPTRIYEDETFYSLKKADLKRQTRLIQRATTFEIKDFKMCRRVGGIEKNVHEAKSEEEATQKSM